MLKSVLDVAVPVLVFLMMAVVGLGLTAEDFRRVASRPRLVVTATGGQVVFIPLLALALVRSLAVAPDVGDAVLLVAPPAPPARGPPSTPTWPAPTWPWPSR